VNTDSYSPAAPFIFGPSSAGGAISVFAVNMFISPLYDYSKSLMGIIGVDHSVAATINNTLHRCKAESLLLGNQQIPALASFSFGGGIGVSVGVVALSNAFSTLNVQNISFSGSIIATGNDVSHCTTRFLVSFESGLPFDPIAFGGGISLFVGSHVFANEYLTNPLQTYSVNFFGKVEAQSNTISSCAVVLNFVVYGSAIAGGGISIHIGGHSQFFIFNQQGVMFTRLVARAPASLIGLNSEIVCDQNIVSNCNVSAAYHAANGCSARGGGISVVIGGASAIVGFGYRGAVQGFVTGSSDASYYISAAGNIVSQCLVIVNSSVSSSGAVLSGGGINVAVGASCFSFSALGSSLCSAGDSMFSGIVNLSANTVSRCQVYANSRIFSVGTQLRGGCISATFGASILSNGQTYSGSNTFGAHLVASHNNLSDCYLNTHTNGEDQASSVFGGE
jgi:hypothetical protein